MTSDRANHAGPTRRSLGFSLVEVAMVLAVVALLVAGVLIFFNNASTNQKTNDAAMEVAALSQAVRALYAGQPDYSNLSSGTLAGSGQIPQHWVKSPTALTNTFSATVTVGSTNTNTNFFISMAGVPNLACTKFLSTDMGTGLIQAFIDASPVTLPMNPANAAAACTGSSNANAHVIVYVLD
jgi:major structural subunit of bundle-forming pilus